MSDYASFIAREIVTTRVLNAPRELVFSCFTTPEYLARWWGPKGFRNTFHTCDPVPGGVWSFIMHGPDGKDYPNESRFLAVDAPDRIQVEHVSKEHFLLTVTFDDFSGRTKVTFRQLFDSPEVTRAIMTIVAPSNEENFDRLEAVVQGLSA